MFKRVPYARIKANSEMLPIALASSFIGNTFLAACASALRVQIIINDFIIVFPVIFSLVKFNIINS